MSHHTHFCSTCDISTLSFICIPTPWQVFSSNITCRILISIRANNNRFLAITISAHGSRYGAILVRYNPGNVMQKPVRTYVISVLHVILHLWVINVFQHHQRLLTAAISLAGLWSEYEPTITMRFLAILFGAHVGMVLFRFDTIQEMSFKSQSEITHSWATYVTPHTFLFYMWYFNFKFHLYSNTMTGFSSNVISRTLFSIRANNNNEILGHHNQRSRE